MVGDVRGKGLVNAWSGTSQEQGGKERKRAREREREGDSLASSVCVHVPLPVGDPEALPN